jgi:hypothetical protein
MIRKLVCLKKKSMNRKIVLWGATGQAKVLWELFEHTQDHVIAIFENNQEIIQLSSQKKVPIFYGKKGFLEWKAIAHPDKNQIYGLAAIGGSRGQDRIELQNFMHCTIYHRLLLYIRQHLWLAMFKLVNPARY